MATTLRRRAAGAGADAVSHDTTTRDESPTTADGGKKVKVIHHVPRARKTRNTGVFLLGSLFGIIAAGFFAKSNDLIAFPEFGELSMDSLLDVMPAMLVKDVRDIVVSIEHHALRRLSHASC
jgi:phospholipid:diacylglycerol acyltransferase